MKQENNKQLIKTNHKIISILVKVGIVLLLFFLFLFFTRKSIQEEAQMNRLEIIQLKANGSSQMMGYLLTTENGKTIVIDGGTSDDTDNLIKHIKEKTGKVDAWFITHPHRDHATSLINIIQNTDIPIDAIYVSLHDADWYKQYEEARSNEAISLIEALQNERIKDKVHEVSLNEKIQIDNVKAEILGIKNPEITTRAINNSSMVIKMKTETKSVLFLGDTGAESGEKLLKTQKEKLKADIVQVAHHGQNGVTKEVYEAIDPQICLWPTPEWLWNNDKGEGEDSGPWNTKETRKWMEELGVKQNIIEKDGDITFSF
jgi:beta-lactamase superfamily II metal-dependent hydrolase